MADDDRTVSKWSDQTVRVALKKLIRKTEEQDEQIAEQQRELDEQEEHVKVVAEAKVVVKWLKNIAIAITTIAGVVVALKQMGVLD